MNDSIHVNQRGRVLEIEIDRPPANAINQKLSDAIHAALKTLQGDDDLRVGIITGAGEKIFCAGWDLKEVAQNADSSAAMDEYNKEPQGGFGGICEFWGLKKPVIAAVNGHAVGGGLEIAIACDIILCRRSRRLLFCPRCNGAFCPTPAQCNISPGLIPVKVAIEMMLTGRRMPAAEAKGWGLVHEVLSPDALIPKAREMADSIAEGAPLTLQALKEVLYPMLSVPLPDAFNVTRDAIRNKIPGQGPFPIYERMLKSDDFMEGAIAFAEKRKPEFKGE